MKKILLLLLLLGASSSQARELADIRIPDSIQLAGRTLVLNGAGIRYKFFFKIYLGALYVPEASSNAGELIQSNGPKRMLMHFIYSEVSREKMINGWLEGFENNLSEADFKQLKPRIDQFDQFFETMKENDTAEMDFVPGKGTVVRIKGKEKGVIPGADFYQALLKVWLGDEPPGASFKQQLLGDEE